MTLRKQKTFYFSLFALVLLFAVNHYAQAAGLVPCGGVGEAPCKVTDIFILIARVTNWLLRVAGIYATYKIVQAGFNLAISQGNDEKITQNKAQITNAIIGMVLALMAYLFVNTIVNFLLLRGYEKCRLELTDPLNYLTVNDQACKQMHEQNLNGNGK